MYALTPDDQANKTTTKKAPAKATTKKARAKATTKRAPAKSRGEPSPPAPTHEAVAKRAHELYEAQGGGDPIAHWLEAERDLSPT